MRRVVPTRLRKDKYTFSAEELEGMFSVPSKMPKWEPMYTELTHRDGSKHQVLIREIKKEEIDPMLAFIKRYTEIDYDYYDIVSARVYAELLAIKRNRMKDEYFFLALENGSPVGIINGRIMNKDINISLHTMVFKRRINAGPILFYAKCWYAFEICGQQEFWATFESYNGWRLAGLGMGLPTYKWPDVQHELGGAKVYYLSREMWELTIRDEYPEQVARAKLMPNPPKELIEANEKLIIPEEIEV